MVQKAVMHLEVEKNERVYTLIMPIGSPLGEAYDAAFEMLQKISELAKEAVERSKREEENKEEEEKSIPQ